MKDIDGYITKDELYRLISRIKYKTDIVVDDTTCNIIIEAIYAMPKADVQPVKHGRWSECYTDTHHYSGICSVCGKASIKSITESLYNYCPKCGAIMNKGN